MVFNVFIKNEGLTEAADIVNPVECAAVLFIKLNFHCLYSMNHGVKRSCHMIHLHASHIFSQFGRKVIIPYTIHMFDKYKDWV